MGEAIAKIEQKACKPNITVTQNMYNKMYMKEAWKKLNNVLR